MPGAAVAGERRAEQAQLAEHRDQLVRERARRKCLPIVGITRVGHELAHGVAHHALLVGEELVEAVVVERRVCHRRGVIRRYPARRAAASALVAWQCSRHGDRLAVLGGSRSLLVLAPRRCGRVATPRSEATRRRPSAPTTQATSPRRRKLAGRARRQQARRTATTRCGCAAWSRCAPASRDARRSAFEKLAQARTARGSRARSPWRLADCAWAQRRSRRRGEGVRASSIATTDADDVGDVGTAMYRIAEAEPATPPPRIARS